MTFVIAILLALLSSPSLFFFEPDNSLITLSQGLMVGITIGGLAVSFIYRQKSNLGGFALAVAMFSILVYICLVFLSFVTIKTEHSQWNIFAFLTIPFLAIFYYEGGVLSGFLLGMHRQS